MTTYTIRHSHGLTESHDSYATAVEALKSVYGAEVYAVDGNGWECTDSEEWPDGSGHGSILSHQREVYYEELKKQLRPVVDKAIWVLEKNLETARRLGYDSPFIEETEATLSHLQRVLAPEGNVLGQPHARLADDGERSEATPWVPADSPNDELTAADRKLFVPTMTPLAP